jgi:SAM-dependent methyltransferase
MAYDTRAAWTKSIVGGLDGDKGWGTFPAQGLIRILRGRYPLLPELPLSGLAIDVGCGDGRNAELLAESGYEVIAFEIEERIVKSLSEHKPGIDFRVGMNHRLDLDNNSCALTVSWHACYYMGLYPGPLEDHLRELVRVTQPSGAVILSIPMPTSFIFRGSVRAPDREDSKDGVEYRIVTEDPFGIRNGEVLGTFESEQALTRMLRRHCQGPVVVGTETGDWFGLAYNWWDVVAIK